MIDQALLFVADRLNRFLKSDGSQVDRLVLGPLIEQDGTVPNANDDKIVLTLASIEQIHDIARTSRMATRRSINLSLHLLFAASFQDYATGLHYLSRTIAFLEANPVFGRTAPGLPSGIDQLAFDMASVGYSELSHLWSGLGAKYMPSALYLMRMITLEGQELESAVPAAVDATGEDSP